MLMPCLPCAISPSQTLTSDYQEGALDSAENGGGRPPLSNHPGGLHGAGLCSCNSPPLLSGQDSAPSDQLKQPR
jgi:hypothetical protein